ncbi:unnamed protein product, partial [Musa textilis]
WGFRRPTAAIRSLCRCQPLAKHQHHRGVRTLRGRFHTSPHPQCSTAIHLERSKLHLLKLWYPKSHLIVSSKI